MAVRIRNVKRVGGEVKMVSATIGDITISFIQRKGKGFPLEIHRFKESSRIMGRDSLWIPDRDYRDLCQRVAKIFDGR